MKIIKRTGLVPVKFVKGSLPYSAGETCGLTPSVAREALASGVAVLLPISKDVETVEVGGPALDPPVKTPDPSEKEKTPQKEVLIPENWEAGHHLTRIKLACEILGVERLTPPDGVKATDFANSVIRDEVAKRNHESGDDSGEGDDSSKDENADEAGRDESNDDPAGAGEGHASTGSEAAETQPPAKPAADAGEQSQPAE